VVTFYQWYNDSKKAGKKLVLGYVKVGRTKFNLEQILPMIFFGGKKSKTKPKSSIKTNP